MRTRNWLILATAIVATVVLIAFWINSILPPPPDFPATDVAPVSPHYLPFVPVSWRDVNESRIFLVDASPRYGYYKNQTSSGRIRKGDPCFIINVTVRNDYTEEQPPPHQWGYDYNFSRFGYYVYFEALLYSNNGEVDVRKVAVDQMPGSFVGSSVAVNFIRIDSGKTRNFDIYVATDNRDINRFELYVYDVGGQLVP